MYLGYEIANFRREEYHNKAPGGGTFGSFVLDSIFGRVIDGWPLDILQIVALAAAREAGLCEHYLPHTLSPKTISNVVNISTH